MTTLRQAMNQMFENAWVRPTEDGMPAAASRPFAIDLYETEDHYGLSCVLPGVRSEDLTVTAQGNVLTIAGEVKHVAEEKANYHVRERSYGRFSRQVTLPEGVRADAVQARLVDGILHLTLPKGDELKPRRIEIQTTAAPQLVEGRDAA
jgi:HSP20 family protein